MKKLIILMVLGGGLLTGCKKILEKTSGSDLDYTQAYQNVDDADAAVMGIYGKFMGLAKQYVVLNELRADLLEYTDNADKYLRQISNHTVTEDNPYISPRPFYEVIINCNDVLKNLNIMYQEKKISQDNYNQRYSDIACLRSFLYLQLGIHYGDQVRYVTSPLENLDDVNNESLFPQVTFDALLDSLINFTEAIPYKEPYATGSTLNITLDAYPTAMFFINKKCLLGDLYLWKGNYNMAASYYREVMETATAGGSSATDYYDRYRLSWWGASSSGSEPSGIGVYYYPTTLGGSIAALTYDVGWRTIFNSAYTTKNMAYECIWALPYDNKFAPVDSLIDLFSPVGGSYLVKPSQQIVDLWNSQQQKVYSSGAITGLPYDARGLLSTQTISGQLVAMKYLYNYLDYATGLPVDVLVKDGNWYLYRATHLHLRFAEAANRQGYYKLGYALFNDGVVGTYDSAAATDKTNWQNTLDYPYPYNFDARNSGSSGVPYYRGVWYRGQGVRGRANLQNYVLASSDSLTAVEDGLLQEGALENAFEGTRWADLLRIARRRNDPAFLADKVYQKLLKDGDPNAAAARAKLMSKEGWYLPFKL
ncbi:MAG: RagB/SusD family protein [Niabella sp.]